mgnify:CR=1 FL=1
MSLPNPAELISQMAIRLKAHLEHRAISEPRFIGIRTGGCLLYTSPSPRDRG